MKLPFSVLVVLVALGLGATVLRGAVPVGETQTAPVQPASPNPAQPKAAPSLVAQTAIAPLRAAGAKLQNEQNTIDIVRKFEPGLVYITTESQVQGQDPFIDLSSGNQVQEGAGSGFFVNATGDILTNFHVVGDADRIQVRLLNQQQTFSARVVGRAPAYDLALIRADKLPKNFIKPIPLGDSDRVTVGQKAVAMGAPFGFDFTVTEGIVSATGRVIPIGVPTQPGENSIPQRSIQTDAAINPGNSGGPLLDSSGRVIGINTQIISPSGAQSGTGQSAGVGFAIPINMAKKLLPRLQAGATIYAPRIGINTISVGLSEVPAQVRQRFGWPGDGVLVTRVAPGSLAQKAGIRGGQKLVQLQTGNLAIDGDVITKVNGQPVSRIEDVQSAIVDKQPGDQLTLTLLRGKTSRNVKLTLDQSAFKRN